MTEAPERGRTIDRTITVKRITLAVLTALALAPALGTPQARNITATMMTIARAVRRRRIITTTVPAAITARITMTARAAFGRICVTARGNCPTRPGPFNAPCGCEIPGFGLKRGAIGG